ncbi:iron ABC transporter permease [Pseudomonas syringae]|nr:iron ABC transporter permease [Pseudomonas syringae]MBD8575766.1 iron ABC transporter permease [Pseudomonas syringae]MBD8791224.1 iron ABC transporter permease [Pseudomonas syringae]MBD8802318.1 iron ABC transporter permease [Pseudomonas syringae]MBD8812857.1 iron ABC transporter permease [Pseudomonas syringae]
MKIEWLAILLGAWLLTGCDDSAPAPQGFAGLGAQTGDFTEVTPGRRFVFPQDHAPHPGFRIEWWYITANLQDASGQPFGVQWTLFRSARQAGPPTQGWSDPNLWMGHAAVTSATRHYATQRLGRGGIGQAGVTLAPFTAWIDDWSLSSTLPAGSRADPMNQARLQASSPTFAYDLHLSTDRPLVLQGDQGYSRKSEQGQASYYYSQPFFTVQGQLRIDGQDHSVKGQAWLDREWSSQPLTGDQRGWDWFSLHLHDGTRLMLYRIRHDSGARYLIGNWIGADGQSQPLAVGDIRLEPLQTTDVAGKAVPTRWSIQIPGKHLAITAEALNPKAWMDLDVPYWEGPVTVSGSQEGVGYLEMTGY